MVNVIGLGYIGLPTALMMASHGVEVVYTGPHVKTISEKIIVNRYSDFGCA